MNEFGPFDYVYQLMTEYGRSNGNIYNDIICKYNT